MEKKTYRKEKAAVFLLLSMFLMVGFGSKKVELFKADKNGKYKLIYLDKAIQNAEVGKQGNTSASKKEEENSSINKEAEGKETAEPKQVNEKAAESYQIIVSGENVTFGNAECKTLGDLRESIEKYCIKGTKLSIVDDYADSKTYQEVLEMVEEMSEMQGFDVERE